MSPIKITLVPLKMGPTYCKNVQGQGHHCECKQLLNFYSWLSGVLYLLRNALFYINKVVVTAC